MIESISAEEALLEGLEQLQWPALHVRLPLLTKYMQEIELWNQRFGLVSYRSSLELVVRHVLDSIAPWEHFTAMKLASLADVGSGAGLPGIPLAITFPEVRTTLIERMGKRSAFLEGTLAVLGRDDVQVHSKPVEEVKERFDVLTFRAFSPLDPDLIRTLGRIGSRVAAYKGKKETFEPEIESVQNLVKSIDVIPIEVPFLEEERHLVVLNLK